MNLINVSAEQAVTEILQRSGPAASKRSPHSFRALAGEKCSLQ